MPPDTQAFHVRSDPDVMIVENDQDVPTAVPKPIPADKVTDMMDLGNNIGHSPAKKRDYSSSSRENNFASASTSSGTASTGPKMLTFNIKYCDRVIKIRLPDSANLSKLVF